MIVKDAWRASTRQGGEVASGAYLLASYTNVWARSEANEKHLPVRALHMEWAGVEEELGLGVDLAQLKVYSLFSIFIFPFQILVFKYKFKLVLNSKIKLGAQSKVQHDATINLFELFITLFIYSYEEWEMIHTNN